MKSLAVSAVCLVLLVVIVLGVWGFVSWQNHSARNLAVAEQVKAGSATVAAGQAEAAQAAQTVFVAGTARDRSDNQVHLANVQAIAAAPGADAPVDPALNAAGRAGLCRHPAYSADPGCAELLGGHPAVVPPAGPAGDAP
jgi:hypothetical protein